MPITNAMVLAAGLGTRLRPITDTMPKPLVPVAGVPMINTVLDLLADAGVETAVVNVHHFADRMEAHLAERASPRILISDERDGLMNSGGGLARGLALLPDGPVLVMNADLFWIGETPGQPSNLERLADVFDPDIMDMALLCVRLEDTTGHNGKLDFSLADDGRLTRFAEGMANPVVYAGAIAMHTMLLDDAPNNAFNLNIYFDRAIEKGRLYGLVLEGHWLTVGTPEAIGDAEAVIARLLAKAG
ncbi:nucleotidyltransferase family protein [Pararhizobium antarcticum]|uniref:Mannose-1-phosphate guanylyltransferase n=1 Tax=Pararhizobium antarcticum TaxID=1798805 RepID=A0A657LVX5_9HYPH|nr:nucleotidyltransferase family protein [Pararhizobium antarcticum]OJF98405.1 mannose-1-phosphate guanylyltransferase [Pararhizobium antarcticum]OJG01078.1 mannose-1-phosphate guanylyltransferase [Rhizobium sp. 58]